MMKEAEYDDFTRYNGTIRLSSELSKYFTLRAGAIYSNRDKRYPYVTNSTTADPWLYLYRWGPVQPMGTENGDPIRVLLQKFHKLILQIRKINTLMLI